MLQINYLENEYRNIVNKLTEKVFDLSEDVEYIYDVFFRDKIENYIDIGIAPKEGVYGNMYSDELISSVAVESDSKNPVKILCGASIGGSSYNPVNQTIRISLSDGALRALAVSKKRDISWQDKKTLEVALSEKGVKQTIAHELSHWVQDSLYSGYIYTLISKAMKLDIKNPQDRKVAKKLLHGKEVNSSAFEIDAQIHGLVETKTWFSQSEWDEMTVADLFYEYPALRATAVQLYAVDKKVYEQWVRDLIKRMARENILGKSMVAIPTIKELQQIEEQAFLVQAL